MNEPDNAVKSKDSRLRGPATLCPLYPEGSLDLGTKNYLFLAFQI